MKFYLRFYLLLFLAFSFFAGPAFAQTISVSTNFDTGIPYSRGSSIAVPVHIDNSAGDCIAQTNTYRLYLSNASGNFAAETQIGVVNNSFYITYMNGVIPASTPPGTGYKVRVVSSSNPGATIVTSGAFTITAGAAIAPNIGGNSSLGGTAFGACNSQPYNFSYSLQTGSPNGSVIFFNESTQTIDSTTTLPSGNFPVQQTNYTIIVKSTDGTNYGSKAYTIMNNTASNTVTATGSNSVCLAAGGSGGAALTYNISLTDLAKNYPGNTYTVTWGDGGTSTYTYCDLINSAGAVSHIYTQASCGNLVTGHNNEYEVAIQPSNPLCPSIGTRVTTYARILLPPVNKFTGPLVNGNLVSCTNTQVTFTNESYPGQDPATGNCDNQRARYTWYVDGIGVKFSSVLADHFQYTFTTPGVYHVRLELDAGTSDCGSTFLDKDICIQDSPTPSFTVPSATCQGSTVTPTNTFVVDNTCFTNIYLWKVTGPAAVTYAGGTSTASVNPQITFNTPGTYKIDLSVTDACGNIKTAPQQTIVVNAAPIATLSANAFFCGPQILDFNTTPGKTQVSFSGTTNEQATTYTWAVTGGAFTFTNGTNTNSKYPQINFIDYATYTVSVTHVNNCGTVTKSQQIVIQDAPTPNAGSPATICPAPTYGLNGTVTGNTAVVTGYTWTKVTGGDGTLSNATTLTPTYTLGANDLAHGGVIQFKLTVNTSLGAPCNVVTSTVNITINSPDYRTSAGTNTLCSGQAQNYTITSTNAAATYTWTAAIQSGTATGFTASGTGNKITDAIVNTDLNADAVIKYSITATTSTCVSTPFDYVVTVRPKPVLAAIADATICSGTPTNIALTATPTGTKFTWIASGPGVTGFSNSTVAVNGPITQTLTNNTTAPVTVYYTITPVGPGGCSGAPIVAKVIVQPNPTVADAGVSNPSATPAIAVCSQGATSTVILNANTPVVGTGKWTLLTGQTGITFDDDTKPNAKVSGLIVGEVYKFRWSINFDPSCITSTADITVTVDPPSVGGTTLFNNGTDQLTICTGGSDQVKLSGQTGNVIRWEKSIDNGTTWTIIAGNNTAPTYNFTNLTQTTQFRAVVQNGVCAFANSSAATVTVNIPPSQPNAGNAQTLCNQVTYQLNGNTPPLGTVGTWSLSSSQTGITFDDPHNPTATASGLVGGQVYIFTWTFNNASVCGITSNNVTITDESAIVNTISSSSTTVCAGSVISLNDVTTSGGNPPYNYLWEKSTDNGATWSTLTGQTGPSATATITVNTQFRRTVATASCSQVSNVVTINTEPGIDNNTLPASVTMCGNVTPALIAGSTPTGGGNATVVYFYQWQQSTDGTNYTDIPSATGKDYQPTAQTGITYYRRVVRTTLCFGAAGSTSNVYTITINPDVTAKFTAQNQNGCAPFNITSTNINAVSDPNAGTYTWYADGVQIGTGFTFPGYTITNENVTVNIKLVVTSSLGCADQSFALDFSTFKQSAASFTADRTTSCGTVDITFTNTSSTSNNVTYTWDFGDGSPLYVGVTPPTHTFKADQFGNDAIYTVKLTAGGCVPTFATQDITVYAAKPVAIIDPGPPQGCSPYAISVKNLSLGTNAKYVFHLFDETNTEYQAPITTTDKSTVTFNPINATNSTRIFTVYMDATNLCGITTRTNIYPIVIKPTGITPRMFITPVDGSGTPAGCAPFQATFHNISTGGTGYVYNIYDSNFNPVTSIVNNNLNALQTYNFDTSGTYYVSVGVFSDCGGGGVESAKIKVVVYSVPAPNFTSDATTTACSQMVVNFTNTTPGTPALPASSYSYVWNFGDGTQSNAFSPQHTFDYKGSPYTVTLSATNSNGCFAGITKTAFITVNPPPLTDFTVKPDTILNIPNYRADFVDKTQHDPVKWQWDFGDKSTSVDQNPVHTYADTGIYKVTLTTVNKFGCTDTKTHIIRVMGIPGQLYVPNAFMPTSLTQELRTFTIKGSGIEKWDMRIFNNWGQLIFETTKLSAKGEPIEFWDGTFRGQPVPQGVYAWEISAHFINGTDWRGMSYRGSAPKRAGTLTLIR